MSEWFYSPYIGKLFKDISHVPEFEKDIKKLVRRFASLEEDLQTFIKVAMNAFHKQNVDSRAIFHISYLGIHSPKIYKARKFACKALKGKGVQSGIRVIYAYDEDKDRVEFIEVYYPKCCIKYDADMLKNLCKATRFDYDTHD
jgi:mRNA-degrading endonuclease RelE of RelBE toxin-antitoxin system